MNYFDYAATGRLNIKALDKMASELKDEYEYLFDNPSSIHFRGFEANKLLNMARQKIAFCLECNSEEIIFTSGGTESNNLALIGSYYNSKISKPNIITSTLEHPSILQTCKFLEKLGCEIIYIKPNTKGILNPKDIENKINKNTILVSIMTVNNEIGTIQPIESIYNICKKYNVPFHSDCVQAIPEFLPNKFNPKNYDMLSLSGHKFGGYAGVGVFMKRKNININPLIYGGGQEKGLISGTQNVFGIVNMAYNLEIAIHKWQLHYDMVKSKKINFYEELKRKYKDNIILNGDLKFSTTAILNISFKNLDGRVIQSFLSSKDIYVSTGSACSSNGDEETSYVLKEIKCPLEFINGNIRISFSYSTKIQQVRELYEYLCESVDYLYEIKKEKE